MYLHYKVGAPAPMELLKWNLAKEYGWTLDYIDTLSMQDIHEYCQIHDGINKARK